MMAGRNVSLRGLRFFCVAGRRLSFRRAAEELFVSTSAVSHQIRSLERELEVALFVRKPSALELTEEGARLFAEVDPLIRRIDAVTRGFSRRVGRRSLRISVQPFFASEMFVPRLPEFTQAHPGFDLHVDTSDESSERHPSEFDVSVRLFRVPPPGFHAERLLPLALVPAASADFAGRWAFDEGEFPIIVHTRRAGAWREWAASAGRPPLKPRHVLKLDSMIAVARAAERGLGAALVPVPLSDAWFRSGSLVRLSEHTLLTRSGYYFVCRHEDLQREDVRALREWMLRTFGCGHEKSST